MLSSSSRTLPERRTRPTSFGRLNYGVSATRRRIGA